MRFFGGKHADNAVEAAINLQRATLSDCLESKGEDQRALPLRIGINSGSLYIGDIGNDRRRDVTLIGQAVNFASRLEAVCEPYRIMISQATWSRLSRNTKSEQGTRQKLVQVRHFKEVFEAIELDCLHSTGEDLGNGLQIFNRFRGVSRNEQRWNLPEGLEIKIRSPYGSGRIVNYSRNGFAIAIDSYLSRGFQTQFEVDLPATLDKNRAGTQILTGEVRWGRPYGDEFLHGIMMTNISGAALDNLLVDFHLSSGRLDLINLMKPKESA